MEDRGPLPSPTTADTAAALRGFKTYLVAECSLSPLTVQVYLHDVASFLRGPRDYAAVTLSDVMEYVRAATAQGAAATTINRRLSALRVFYRYLMFDGVVTASPLEFVPSVGLPRRLPDYLHLSEVEAILGVAAKRCDIVYTRPHQRLVAYRNAAMLSLAYGCGLRASELTAAERANVDLSLAFIAVRGKGGKERLVPFGDVTARRLTAYLDICKEVGVESRYLFPSRWGKKDRPVSRQTLWKVVKETAAAAGVPAVKPHLFRHTFATHLIQAGADLRSVQEILGHANVATTQIYAHLDTRSLVQAHAKYHPRK